MTKIIEAATNLLWKTQIGWEAMKAFDTLKSVVGFSNDAKDAKSNY